MPTEIKTFHSYPQLLIELKQRIWFLAIKNNFNKGKIQDPKDIKKFFNWLFNLRTIDKQSSQIIDVALIAFMKKRMLKMFQLKNEQDFFKGFNDNIDSKNQLIILLTRYYYQFVQTIFSIYVRDAKSHDLSSEFLSLYQQLSIGKQNNPLIQLYVAIFHFSHNSRQIAHWAPDNQTRIHFYHAASAFKYPVPNSNNLIKILSARAQLGTRPTTQVYSKTKLCKDIRFKWVCNSLTIIESYRSSVLLSKLATREIYFAAGEDVSTAHLYEPFMITFFKLLYSSRQTLFIDYLTELSKHYDIKRSHLSFIYEFFDLCNEHFPYLKTKMGDVFYSIHTEATLSLDYSMQETLLKFARMINYYPDQIDEIINFYLEEKKKGFRQFSERLTCYEFITLKKAITQSTYYKLALGGKIFLHWNQDRICDWSNIQIHNFFAHKGKPNNMFFYLLHRLFNNAAPQYFTYKNIYGLYRFMAEKWGFINRFDLSLFKELFESINFNIDKLNLLYSGIYQNINLLEVLLTLPIGSEHYAKLLTNINIADDLNGLIIKIKTSFPGVLEKFIALRKSSTATLLESLQVNIRDCKKMNHTPKNKAEDVPAEGYHEIYYTRLKKRKLDEAEVEARLQDGGYIFLQDNGFSP